jgi:hypothetical protein
MAGNLMLDKELMDTVIASWTLDQDFPGRDRKKKPVPDAGDIKEILDQAFLARTYPQRVCQ